MRAMLSLFLFLNIVHLSAQQPVIPTLDENHRFVFHIGNVTVVINPSHGARIESYKLDESEFLYLESKPGQEDNYGSTCWLSPQYLWGWPPQKEIDTDPYNGGIVDGKLVLTSGAATANNNISFSIAKTFSADLHDSSFTIKYEITNKSSEPKSFATWEVMRVPVGGLTFFPINGEVCGGLAPAFEILDGIAFWDSYRFSKTFYKGYADGKDGWLAHVDKNRLLHFKKFSDTQSNFPKQDDGLPYQQELEFWANDKMYYNEIEKQSAYNVVAINASSVLTITWYLRRLPESINPAAGNPALIKYVQRFVE